jgi:hypothetical protein
VGGYFDDQLILFEFAFDKVYAPSVFVLEGHKDFVPLVGDIKGSRKVHGGGVGLSIIR